MNYSDLIRLYFERSTALQWYWTTYLVIIGGLLAFSSLRQRPAFLTTLLVSVLYVCFACKNLGAIHDVTTQRTAVVQSIKNFPQSGTVADVAQRGLLEPTLDAPAYEGIRNFHVSIDLLTIITLWSMEWRRRRLTPDTV